MPVALSQKAAAEYLGISVARLRKVVAAGYLTKNGHKNAPENATNRGKERNCQKGVSSG
jgi:hypothetical protein